MPLAARLLGCTGLLLLVATGCSGGKPDGAPETVPTTVTIKYKGTPVEGATVTFLGGGNSVPAFGRTDAQGVATMRTHFEGFDLEGAPVGTHKVTVLKAEAAATTTVDQDSPEYVPPELQYTAVAPPRSLIPPKYGMVATTNLTAEVKAGEPLEFSFELTD